LAGAAVSVMGLFALMLIMRLRGRTAKSAHHSERIGGYGCVASICCVCGSAAAESGGFIASVAIRHGPCQRTTSIRATRFTYSIMRGAMTSQSASEHNNNRPQKWGPAFYLLEPAHADGPRSARFARVLGYLKGHSIAATDACALRQFGNVEKQVVIRAAVIGSHQTRLQVRFRCVSGVVRTETCTCLPAEATTVAASRRSQCDEV
jgi:hypothetical protein